MITIETAVAMAVRDRSVLDQLGEALRSDLVVANPFLRRLAAFADDFALLHRKVPENGDWEMWLDTLQPGMERDGSKEALGRLLAMDLSGFTPEFFATNAHAQLQHAAVQTARARLAAMADVPPEAFATLTQQIERIRTGAVQGLARLADVGVWAAPSHEHDRIPTGFPGLDKMIGGWGKELWIIFADSGMGKALDVETPIPTPTGWAPLGKLKPGDWVFDEKGYPTQILAATRVMRGRPCYAVEFGDGNVIVADACHQWVTAAYSSAKRRVPRVCRLRTTQELSESLLACHRIGVAGPLCLPAGSGEALPIDPYVLGVWLGDGWSWGAQFTTADPEIVAAVRAAGETVRKCATGGVYRYAIGDGRGEAHRGKRLTYETAQRIKAACLAGKRNMEVAAAFGVGRGLVSSIVYGRTWNKTSARPSFGERLRSLNLIQNKHIPPGYLRASAEQRLALLQGLMDTDGYIGKDGGCSFCTVKPALRDGVLELCRSLGLQVHVGGRQPKRGRFAYYLQFRAHRDVLQVCRLKRKAVRLHSRPQGPRLLQSMNHAVVAVRAVESRPVRCIQVAARSGLFLAGVSMVPTHNSMLLQNCAANLARGGKRVLHVTLELGIRPQIQRYYRQLAQASRAEFVHQAPAMRSRLEHWFRLAQGEIFLLESPAYSVDPDQLKRSIERVSRTIGDIDVLVLDYLDLVTLPVRARAGRGYEDLGRITHELRGFCPTFDLLVLTASQAVRRPEHADRLTVRDMGDSYNKVRGADGLLSLVQTPEEEETHQGRLGLLKSRDSGGRNQEIPVYINRELALIQDLDHPNTIALMKSLGHIPVAATAPGMKAVAKLRGGKGGAVK